MFLSRSVLTRPRSLDHVVIHSYRHRIGNAPGESRFRDTERTLAERPPITVPSIVLMAGFSGL